MVKNSKLGYYRFNTFTLVKHIHPYAPLNTCREKEALENLCIILHEDLILIWCKTILIFIRHQDKSDHLNQQFKIKLMLYLIV